MEATSTQEKNTPWGVRLLTEPLVYKWILALRHVLDDLTATAFFVAAVIAWEILVNDATPTRAEVLESTGLISWWTNDVMIPTMPAVVAGCVFLMGLRVGARMMDPESMRGLFGQSVLYVTVLAIAVSSMTRLPGGPLALYVPLAAAVLVAVRVRRRRSQGPGSPLRRPTTTGFRPSRRATFLIWGRSWLDSTNKAYPVGLAATTNIAETTMHDAAKYFLRRKDSRTAAYCIARGVDYLLLHAELAEAERVVRNARKDTRLARQPALQAAHALLLQAVGRKVEAHGELVHAARRAHRIPAELQAFILESAIDLGTGLGVPPADTIDMVQWSTRMRIAAIWRRQVNAVVFSLIIEARTLADDRPGRAVDLAYKVAGLPEILLAELREDDTSFESMAAVRGLAFELVASVAFRHEDFPEAMAAYLDASEELRQQIFLGQRYLARAARCLAYGFIAGIYGGYSTPDQESHALDLIRVGLEIIERGRGLLREEEDRAHYIAEQSAIIDAVFDVCTQGISYQHAKAGELGVWLLESLHRTLTADLLASGTTTDPGIDGQIAQLQVEEARVRLDAGPGAQMTDAARTRLADLASMIDELIASQLRGDAPAPMAVDMREVCERLGGRVGVVYQCAKGSGGRWRINAAMITASGRMRVHSVTLPPPGTDPELAAWREPGGVLNILADGDPADVTDVYSNPLSDQVWRELSHALFPEAWWDVICPDDPAELELVIVPDGPLSNLPISALPARSGRLLLEHATVTFAPSFGMLRVSGNEYAAPPAHGPMSVVIHVDDEALGATSAELEQWRTHPSHVVDLIETQTRQELETHLTGDRSIDVISISVHGSPESGYGAAPGFGRFVRLRDQSILSTRAALSFAWPRTVVLGACWIGGVDLKVGREPTGFPIACIQRGADFVIGGTAPIPDVRSAGLLAELITLLPTTPAARALREAQRRLKGTPLLSELPPSQFAGLTCWSVAPTATTPLRPSAPNLPVHWESDGTPASEQTTSGVFDSDQLGQALQRTLAHAQQQSLRQPVSTLGLLRSVFDIDDEPWGSFLLASELTWPVLPGPIDETGLGTVTLWAVDREVCVTVPLANVLRRGIAVRDALRDETVLPSHVVYAALLEQGSGAQAWIARQTSPESKDWPMYLSDMIFRTNLPDPRALERHPLDMSTRHEKRALATKLSDATARRMVSGHNWDNKFTAFTLFLILVFASNSLTSLYSLQTRLQGRGRLGIVLTDNTRSGGGALVETVLPGGAAAEAGLLHGDVLLSVGNAKIQTADDAISKLSGYTKGATVHLVVERSGQTLNLTAKAQPLPTNPTPGSLGITMASGKYGAIVADIEAGGAAQAAGLHVGDDIVEIYGIHTHGDLTIVRYLIRYHNPGSKVTMVIYRGSQTLTIDAVLH
ncbi:PDZ domain-containing protein [Catenulispora rubra]|uniref:PDZ domain-containing protein n=1 Tax=Catenulispora rubra TaxID=280293 RepID=UPI00189239BD|nr:PDZ domain-containing protein [Catenulispora rubra]